MKEPTRAEIIKAFDETIEKYKNPVNDFKWVKENLLQFKTCAFCELFKKSKAWIKGDTNCKDCPLSQFPIFSKCTQAYWYKNIHDAWLNYLQESFSVSIKHKEDKDFYKDRAFERLKWELFKAAIYIYEEIRKK